MSEFQTVLELLRQQKDHLDDHFANFKSEANSRFDRVEVRLDRVDTRLTGVEDQVRLTNGTVRKHTEQLEALETPEKLPLMTKAQGNFAQKLLLKGSVVFGAVYAFVQWVLTHWGHVLPILTGAVR